MSFFKKEDTKSLHALLTNEDSEIRQVGVEIAGKKSVKDQEIIKIIVSLLKDWDPNVREAVVTSIGMLEIKDEQIKYICNLLEDTYWVIHWVIQCSAAEALGQIKSKNPEIIQALQKATKSKWSYVREAAEKALESINNNKNTFN